MRRALLLAPCALALSACGGGGGGSQSTTTAAGSGPLAIAAAKTQAAGSEDMTLKANVTLAGGQGLLLSGTGSFDDKTQSGQLTSRLDVANGVSTTLDEIFQGTVMYLKSPLFGGILGSKPWLEVDLQSSAQKLGFDFKALTGQNPSDVLTQIARTSSSVTTVGKETVGGVSTTHYRASIDPAKIPQGDQIQKLTGATYKPLDVWVDGQDLIRKVHLDYTAKTDPSKSARAHIVLDMTFSNFGAKVNVTPPPADQVSS